MDTRQTAVRLALLLPLLGPVTLGRADDAPPSGATEARSPVDPASIPALDARVVVTDFGEFVIRVDRERAPNASAAFLWLAARDAFDNLTFHRTIPAFLVQTGDPLSRDEEPANDGTAVPPWRLVADASPPPSHRGTVSFAWRGDRPESAGMQWFVLLADVARLEGHGTPIGEVVEGLDVVDRVSQVSTFRNRRPLNPVRIADVRLEPMRGSSKSTGPAGNAEGTPTGEAATK